MTDIPKTTEPLYRSTTSIKIKSKAGWLKRLADIGYDPAEAESQFTAAVSLGVLVKEQKHG